MKAVTRCWVSFAALFVIAGLFGVARAEGAPLKKAPNSPLVRIQMANGRLILIKLFPADAPKTVANFEKLVKQGYYNGLDFHRVADLEGAPGSNQGHIVQGGPVGDDNGGPGWTIPGEFPSNGFNNPLKHNAGAVSMARTGDPNSGGSQFYICTTSCHSLDGNYAVFGQVIEGISAASLIQVGDKMAKVTLVHE